MNFKSMIRPGVIPARQIPSLPYQDLDWRSFELFCADLIGRLDGFNTVQNYGVAGQKQRGVDILAFRKEETWCFQCKKQAKFSPARFERLLSETTFVSDHYVLILSGSASPDLIDRVRAQPNWELWSPEDLDRRITKLGTEASELVTLYFGRDIAQAFLGKSTVTAFLSSQKYFEPFVRIDSAVSLTGDFVDREDAFTQLDNFINSDTLRALVLYGPVGVGKTRLLYEFLQRQPPEIVNNIVIVREAAVLDDNALTYLPADASLVIVDDMARVSQFENLLSHLARRFGIKVILSATAGSELQTKYQLLAFGFDSSEVKIGPEIRPLGPSNANKLIQGLTGITAPRDLKVIRQISAGVPLIIRIIATLIESGEHNLVTSLCNEDYPIDVILSRYQRVLTGRISVDSISQDDSLKVMQMIAAIGPVDVRTPDFRRDVSSFLGWNESKLLQVLEALDNSSIIARIGSKTRVIPYILGLFILKQVCSINRIAVSFATDLVAYFGIRRQLLLNLVAVDSVLPGEVGLFTPVWTSILERVNAAYAYERKYILDEIKDLAYVIPDRMLELAEFLVRNPAKPDPVQTFNVFREANNRDVLRRLPPILEGIAMSKTELVSKSVQLLWILSKDDNTKASSPKSAFKTLVELASYGRYKSVDLNLAVLNEIEHITEESEANTSTHLAIDVIEPVLARSFDSIESVGANMTITRIAVSPANVATVRRKAFDILSSAIRSSNKRVAVRAISMIAKCIQQPDFLVSADGISKQFWQNEQNVSFSMLAMLFKESHEPIIVLQIATQLSWHGYANPSTELRSSILSLLKNVEGNESLDLYAAIHYDFARHLPSIPPGSDFQVFQKSIDSLLERVTSRLLSKNLSSIEFLSILISVLKDLDDAGLAGDASWIFVALSSINLTYAEDIARDACDKFPEQFGMALSAIFYRSMIEHPQVGFDLLRRAVTSDIWQLQAGAAHALWQNSQANFNPADVSRRAELLRDLVSINNAKVQEVALRAVGTLIKLNQNLGLEVLLNSTINDSPEIVDEIFANIRDIDPISLDTEVYDKLLQKLILVTELDYWAIHFLEKIGASDTSAVLGLLRKRIRFIDEKSANHSEYSPVPFAGSLMPHISQFFCKLKLDANLFQVLLNDAFTSKGMTSYWYGELFGNLAVHDTHLVSALSTFTQTRVAENLQFAAAMMHRVTPDIIFRQWQFVADLIDASVEIGDDCGKHVQSLLFAAAASGARCGLAFEPMPQDVELMKESEAIIAMLQGGSAGQRFFKSLREHAVQSINEKREFDADLFDE